MLNFLQNQNSNRRTTKPLVNYKPELIYGHTQQSPNEFKGKFTIYYNQTMNDIKQEYQNTKDKHITISSLDEIKGRDKQKKQKKLDHHYRNNSDFQMPQTIKPLKLRTNQFKLTRGQFTNFLDKNKHNNNIAVAHRQYINKQSRQEFLKKSSSTHQFSWNKSINRQSKYDAKSSVLSKWSNIISDNSNPRIESNKQITSTNSILTRSNSISIFERKASKINILRRKVQQFKDEKQRQILKKLQTKYSNFGLPKIGVNHEIFLLENKKLIKTTKKEDNYKLNQEIQKFEDRMFKKLK